MTNQEIAQEINNRIGNSPVPFDSVYSIALEIYQELGGDESQFDSVYSILLETLNVIDSGISAKVIDDSSISLTKTWSSSKIASELADAGFKVEIVTELPSVGDPHTIYFILKQDSSVGDVYDEWMYINNNWEMVGNTQIDLSDYATIANVDASLALKADKTYVDSSLALKQDVISDLASIRSGAALGATALQSVPAEYVTDTELSAALANKVNKADYTIGVTQSSPGAALELDLSALNSATTDGVYSIVVKTDLLTGVEEFVGFGQVAVINSQEMSGTLQAIKITYNAEATKTAEITRLSVDGVNWQEVNFINAVIDDVQPQYGAMPWSTYSARKIRELLAAKQDVISDLATIRSGAALGATSLQSVPSEYITDSELDASLANYATNASLATKQDTLTAGSNITISGNTISATDTTYVAGEGIEISGNTISATGGNAIEDASVLPDAVENKSKLFRLESDDNVYVSELKSRTSTTTNRLPDEQQIDKAYLYDGGDVMYYKGNWKIILFDGEVDCYGWLKYNNNNEWFLYVTQDDAEHSTENTKMFYFYTDEVDGVDFENHTVTYDDSIEEYQWKDANTISDDGSRVIPATYNAPEANQIGNAYFNDGDSYYYNGVEYTLNYTDGVSIKAYGWVYEGDTSPSLYTPKKASEIYYQNIYNGQIITGKYTDAVVYFIDYETYPIVNNTITLDYPSSEAENAIRDYQIMYIPQLNAPDSEQFGVAQIELDDTIYTYLGEGDYIDTDGVHKTLYGWKIGNTYIGSILPAEEIYGRYIDNHLTTTIEIYRLRDEVIDNGDGTYTLEDRWDQYSNYSESFYLYNFVKYQRTVVTEEWDWLPLTDNATDEDIDAMFASSIA